MIRRCRGPCGKVENRQPRKDARVFYFNCSDCIRTGKIPAELQGVFKCESIRVIHFGRTLIRIPLR